MTAGLLVLYRSSSGRLGRSALSAWTVTLGALLLYGCASSGEAPSPAASGTAAAQTPSVRGYKVGKPYQIKGIWYYPQVDYEYSETGIASWYGPGFNGRSTANGETYDMNDMTAAHRTLPMPSIVRVTNIENGRTLKLRVNDRGPFYNDRIIDVSRRAAQLLGFYGTGTAPVRVDIVADESIALATALGVPVGTQVAAAAPAPAPAAPVAAQPVVYETAPEPAPVVYVASAPETTAGAEPAPVSEPEAAPIANDTVAGYALPPIVSAAAAEEAPPAWAAPTNYASRSALYVQAGAFADPARARVVRQRLSPLGPVVMIPGEVNGRSLLRVRVGPLGTDEEAARVLASVSRAGFPDSRVVIE